MGAFRRCPSKSPPAECDLSLERARMSTVFWRPLALRPETKFFAAMAAVIGLVVALGFGPTYAASLARPGLPLWVHLHGALMAAWVGLFALQSVLPAAGLQTWHRRLGWLSIGLVSVIVPLAFATNILAVKRGATPPFFSPAQMMAADGVDILLFAALYAAAVVLRHRPDWHKRLLLCASTLLTWPAFGRLAALSGVDMPMIIPVASACLVVAVLAGPAFDWIRTRRVHPAYLWGVGLILATLPAHAILAATPWLQGLARLLAA